MALSELKNEVDNLWETASNSNLKKLVRAVKKAKTQIRNTALLIEQNHYDDIMLLLKTFEDYQIGKQKLIENRNLEYIQEYEITNLINQNGELRDKINLFTKSMLKVMRKQISGR